MMVDNMRSPGELHQPLTPLLMERFMSYFGHSYAIDATGAYYHHDDPDTLLGQFYPLVPFTLGPRIYTIDWEGNITNVDRVR